MKSFKFLAAAIAALSFLSVAQSRNAQATVFTSDYVAGYCLDVNMQSKTVGLWNCHGGFNQDFQFSGYGAVKVQDMCLDTAPQPQGKALIMTRCNGSQGQKWGYDQASRQFKNEQGWCADIKGASRDRGTPIIAWNCNAQASNQKWQKGRVINLNSVARMGLTPQQQQILKNADQMINNRGGNIVAAGAGNIVAAGGGNIVAAGGGNIVAAGAGN